MASLPLMLAAPARLAFGACLLLLAAAPGCERSSVVADPEIAYHDYAASIETAECEWRTRCNLEASVESCRAHLFLDRDDPYLDAAVAAETILYHGDAAYRCVDEYAARSCERDPEDDPLPSCAAIFEGQVGPEDPCMIDGECVENGVCGINPNDCVDDAQCCAGACRLLPGKVAEGESCANQFATCEDGTFCARDPMTFQPTVCTANKPIGAMCDFGEGCVDEGFCNYTGYCEAKRGAGQECEDEDWCLEGHRCEWNENNYTASCVATILGAALGEPCSPESGNKACADLGAWCSNTSNTCVLLPGVGEPCLDGNRCAEYATCGNSDCVLLPSVGYSCLGSACAKGLFCDWDADMTCAAPEFAADGCEVPGEPFDAKSGDGGN